MRFHLYNSTIGAIPEYFYLANCTTSHRYLTHGIGLALEGTSALAELVHDQPQQDLREL